MNVRVGDIIKLENNQFVAVSKLRNAVKYSVNWMLFVLLLSFSCSFY